MDLPMKKSKLLNKLPISSQNPLLGSSQFFKYCKERFYHIGNSERDFKWLLNFYKKEKILFFQLLVGKKLLKIIERL